MTQDIIDKLHTALYSVAPLASDRESLIANMGETIWVESLEKTLLALPEEARKEVIELLNGDQLDKAVEILEMNNVDIDTIITEVAISVMEEVLAAGKAE